VATVTNRRLVELAAGAHDSYLRHYRAVLAKERGAHERVVAELLIEPGGNSDTLVRRLLRVDVIWGDVAAPHIIAVQDTPVATDQAALVAPGPPPLEVFPFVWNACEFIWPSPVAFGQEFENWYERWMDLPECRSEDDDGLSGVVHSVTSPGARAGGWGIEVDFGSAPVEAMLELVQLPAFANAGSTRVGSFSYR
jgi:hypothetical protein